MLSHILTALLGSDVYFEELIKVQRISLGYLKQTFLYHLFYKMH